jgi:hypothetical protein
MTNATNTEVLLSAWQIIVVTENGETLEMESFATKRDAILAAGSYLASGCTVRVERT